jgi:hypothetical protein
MKRLVGLILIPGKSPQFFLTLSNLGSKTVVGVGVGLYMLTAWE